MEENIGFVFLNFEPSEENQLAVKLNERVKIIEDEDSHWWFVQSLYSGRFGYIPADIIQTKEEREAFLNQQKNKQLTMVTSKDSKSSKAIFNFLRKHQKLVSFDEKIMIKDTSYYNFEDEIELVNLFSTAQINFDFDEKEPINAIPKKEKWNLKMLYLLRIYAGNFSDVPHYKTILISGNTKIIDIIRILREKFRLNDRYEYQMSSIEESSLGKPPSFILLVKFALAQNQEISEIALKLKGFVKNKSKFLRSNSSGQTNLLKNEDKLLFFSSDSDLTCQKDFEAITHCKLVLNRNLHNTNHGMVPFYLNFEWFSDKRHLAQRIRVNAAMTVYDVAKIARKELELKEPIGYKLSSRLKIPSENQEIYLNEKDTLLVIFAKYSEIDGSFFVFRFYEEISLEFFRPVIDVPIPIPDFDPFNQNTVSESNLSLENNRRISWDSSFHK